MSRCIFYVTYGNLNGFLCNITTDEVYAGDIILNVQSKMIFSFSLFADLVINSCVSRETPVENNDFGKGHVYHLAKYYK